MLPEGEIRALGPATDTGLTTNALTFTDEDGDGLFETATLTANVPSGTTADQVVCRFLAADCDPAERQEVAPRAVTIAANVATVTLDTYTLVKPALYQGAASGAIDPADTTGTGPFAQSLEVVRRRADPTGTTSDTAMAVLTWETQPWPWWACWPSASASTPASSR